jgi:hypothetical protein
MNVILKYMIQISGSAAFAADFREAETRYETWEDAHSALLGLIERELSDSTRGIVNPTRAERERSAMAFHARDVVGDMPPGSPESVSLSRGLSLRIATSKS